MIQSKPAETKVFSFGDNWEDYSKKISGDTFTVAKESVRNLLGGIDGMTFIDIGCGSGLFSIAAAALGASFVYGIDKDPVSVKVSRENLEKIAVEENIDRKKVKFSEQSLFDLPDNEQYDIVYSWGVLHHTGRMYDAFDKAGKLVKRGGTLAVSIYNRHFSSGFWALVKKTYNYSPNFVKKAMIILFYPVIFLLKLVVAGMNPFKMRRGMTFYNNVVDWVGGYPYEYASIKEVTDHFEARGFSTVKIIKAHVATGCNEFVFRKDRENICAA